ncbi:MAG TPA: DUF6036 family nucleotidyltransferase [Solirubrobacteraceae bacterium]|nr:DUF6036 family nucleotidyltransferase [Solirubrobacteraceae bacterium]
MTNISIDSARATDDLLRALGEQLAAHDQHYSLLVVGGSALLALGLVTRATRDVDILALIEEKELVSAQPLPAALLDAAHTVARDFGLPDDWLNSGPTSLLDLGLPEGLYERAQHRDYGPGLEVLFASRVDQIHLKLYATVDQGPGKHLRDLQSLAPTERELLDAADWSQTHDPSVGYRSVLARVLLHFGVDDGRLSS